MKEINVPNVFVKIWTGNYEVLLKAILPIKIYASVDFHEIFMIVYRNISCHLYIRITINLSP